LKRGSLSWGAALAAVVAFCAASPPSSAAPGKTRIVPVLVLGDFSFKRDDRWKVEAVRAFMDANSSLRAPIGIKFVIAGFDYWDPAADPLPARSPVRPGRPSLRALVARLGLSRARWGGGAKAPPAVLVGIIPPGREGLADPGIADYIHGLIVIKRLRPPASVSHALLHELCHLFGAVDLSEKGSVMSLSRATFGLDGFTRQIMRLNRERSFRPGDFPLDEDQIVQAIGLYAEREARGLGENEIGVCLRSLRTELAVLRRSLESGSGPGPAGRPPRGRTMSGI
jgi:hypothetical protein